jgi:DNA-binding PadR family transcriptional regulator
MEKKVMARSNVIRGMLRPIVLGELAKGPLHGYLLIKRIREKFHVYLGPSTMYPALYDLKEAGLIEFDKSCTLFGKGISLNLDSGRPIKVYAITEKGRTALALDLQNLKNITHNLGIGINDANGQ